MMPMETRVTPFHTCAADRCRLSPRQLIAATSTLATSRSQYALLVHRAP
jgi:hypothetical protein